MSAMATQGQTIADRLNAARHSIAGQGLAKAVCKATTEELMAPKKKHLDYLLHCTFEPNVSIPQLANLLIERTQINSWVVVFKSLITVHHLMCYGNERFIQYLASNNNNFQLNNFLDKSGGYDMSTYIRRYAKYLNEKAMSYRAVAFDFCKVKRGKEDGVVRGMNTDKLLKTLPSLQTQIDTLLEFECSTSELSNFILNAAFMFLFRDLIRLFACYNDGIINLLEKYFEMNKKQCRDGLDLYKKFLTRMDRVSEFLKVAERVGVDKGDIPDLTRAPSSLLDALEQHLAQLEGRKIATGGAAGEVLSSDEIVRRQALAEEEAALERIKDQHLKTNPFLSSPTASPAGVDITACVGGVAISDHAATTANGATTTAAKSTTESILDLFAAPPQPLSSSAVQPLGGAAGGGGRASDDLLQLANNPFADITASSSAAAAVASSNAFVQPQQSPQQAIFGVAVANPPSNGLSHLAANTNGVAMVLGNGTGVMSSTAAHIFTANFNGTQTNGTADSLSTGTMLMPTSTTAPTSSIQQQPQPPASGAKLISNDLDMSLQSLVQNLGISGGGGGGAGASVGSSPAHKHNWKAPPQATPGLTAPGMTGAAMMSSSAPQQAIPSLAGSTPFDPFGQIQ